MITCGIDSPKAWGLWSLEGPVDWFQSTKGNAWWQARESWDALRSHPRFAEIRHFFVEVPYGVGRDDLGNLDVKKTQSVILNAEIAGWWHGVIEGDARRRDPFDPVFIDRRRAQAWRSELGFPGKLTRDDAKDIAVRLAAKAYTDLALPAPVGPKGGVRVDASEGLCISMACWLSKVGKTGALKGWIDTGTFQNTG